MTTQQQANRIKGKKAKANGAKAEAQVLKAGAYYTQNDTMMIFKREENLAKKVGADFSIWLKTGKSGFLECKSRNAKSIPLNAVDELQTAQLQAMEKWGYIGAVVVRLVVDTSTGEQHWFFVPASCWTHPTKKSLNLKDLEPYKLDWKSIGADAILDIEKAIKKHY